MKITVSVPEGEKTGAKVSVISTVTGEDYRVENVAPGKEGEFTLEAEQRIAIGAGDAAEVEGDAEDAKSGKK